MTERPSHKGSPSGEPRSSPASADEVEQRQRLDGSLEDDATIGTSDVPLSPDVVEQRQRLDGSVESGTLDEPSDEPLTPDMIDQRRVVEDDDLSEHRETE